jgi:3-deoxy-manno-octulosonate cytidylyltransferase (CMP-KDO synthetase)
MKIVGVIPARYKSTRFEGKPLALIQGKPMIYWVYQQVRKVGKLDEVYVATEDQRIMDACEQYQMACVMTADTHKTGTDRMGEVARKIAADYYINIQGDDR